MKRYFLIFFALTFTLTSTASAGMMCCWDISNDNNQEQTYDVPPPCHESNAAEAQTDNMDTSSPSFASGCCEDMSLCNVPLVFGTNTSEFEYYNIKQGMEFPRSNIFISNSAIPPTPPPKRLL